MLPHVDLPCLDLTRSHQPTPSIIMRASLFRVATRGHQCHINSTRSFATAPKLQAKNRIYPARVRNEDELQTLVLMSASSRTPLLTLWMTTWSRECDEVSPIIRNLIETDRVGEDKGGVSFVEVEMDSPDLGGVSGIAARYLINTIPTLMAFDRSEPQLLTKVSSLEDLRRKDFLTKWIENEAARHGRGGSGGFLSGLFGR